MDSLQGGPPRMLNPLAAHPFTYVKFVMDKYMKEKNMQKIFISRFPSFQILYFSKRIILEELILDKEEEILSLKL